MPPHALAEHPQVGEVRGLGLMCAVELVKDKASKEEFPAGDQIGPRVHKECIKRGLFSRTRGDVYTLAPPIVISEQQIDDMVGIVRAAVAAVLG